ncbi:carbohydrate kinase family protein [Curvivirga aplysinae]|uniref:carbohydrate kinase family protein n=1 Tax=Curvivirga aplysinae TaxID=2529852 RepID=UPI0012BB73EE|nr:carbohydrate kinase family protein [Curvivirga aplysinae]MTI10480.1 carbohydrate kinase family protein [Curvivirga aplysinae]
MKALTIGGATVDIIASVEDHNLERMTMENAYSSFLLLEEGKKVEAQSVDFYVGGGATNAAISMARRGADVACLVKVGDDVEGHKVQDQLRAENVDTRPILIDHLEPTGRAVMIASHAKNPTIFVARGSNTTLREEDIQPSLFKDRDLVYITGLSGDSADCFAKIVTLAKEAGAMVACNPGIRQLSSRSQAFYSVLDKIDMLILNERETAQLIPELSVHLKERNTVVCDQSVEVDFWPHLMKKGLESHGFSMTLPTLFDALLERGIKSFLLTDGKRGAYLADKDGIIFCPSHKAKVRGTAGAGDSFASTCVSEIAMGRSKEIAIKKAAMNAAYVVSHVDAQSGLQDNEILDQRIMDADWDGFLTFCWAD